MGAAPRKGSAQRSSCLDSSGVAAGASIARPGGVRGLSGHRSRVASSLVADLAGIGVLGALVPGEAGALPDRLADVDAVVVPPVTALLVPMGTRSPLTGNGQGTREVPPRAAGTSPFLSLAAGARPGQLRREVVQSAVPQALPAPLVNLGSPRDPVLSRGDGGKVKAVREASPIAPRSPSHVRETR